MKLTSKELDAQSTVVLDGWVDLGSERWKDTDNDPGTTKKFLKMLLGHGLFTDSLGRVWGKSSKSDAYYPFHYEYGSKKYGIRIPEKAAN